MGQELYELPEGWEWRELQELYEIARGGSPRPIKKFITSSDDGINWIKIGDATASTKYIFETKEKITPAGIKKSRLVHDGDFILSNSMSFGRPYIMRTTGCIHDGWLVLKPQADSIDQDYTYHVLSSPVTYRQFDNAASGSTVRNLNSDLVRKVKIPLPPLNERKRIVAKLDALFTRIDTAISHLQRTLELSKALFASALSKKFKLRNKSWRPVKMADVCSITSKLLDPRELEYIDMLHVGGANIESLTGNLIGLKTAREERLISGKFIFDNKVVLYSKIRPYLMKVARPNIHGLCSADIYPLTSKLGVLDRNFLFYLLLSEDFTAYAIQGSSRAGMPKVNRKHLFDYEFSIPSIQEQRKTTDSLDALSERTRTLEASVQEKINDLTTLKASLLDAAFKGQL